ncbi:hypothetical protein COB57_02140 [Candidatus Peregrinibacteria bacterium]|nr:MAG: hypothetical protein COB57_02140 [Candidatus Peregrinibacteria bacterium]
MSEEPKKKSGKIDKMLLGIIIGGAVGSVAGVTLSNKKIRDSVKKKMIQTSSSVKGMIRSQKKDKKSIWHRLNAFFFKK